MGRLKKNSCDYFPHMANMRNHPKVKAIRRKFKENGYSVWNMLLEYLTAADGNEFEHSDMQYELMAGDFDIAAEEIKAVVDYCITLEMLFVRQDFVHSPSLDEYLSPVYKKRGDAKERSAQQKRRENGKFVSTLPEAPVQSVAVIPQTIVEEIKSEETINKFDFKKSMISSGFEKNLVEDWIKVRKTKKCTNTETAFDGFITEVRKTGLLINDVLRQCVEKSWGGFKAEWLVEASKQHIGNNGNNNVAPRKEWKTL